MITLRLAAAATLAGASLMLSPGTAQAYPDGPDIVIDLSGGILVGGRTVSFDVSAEVRCDWTVSLPGGVPDGADSSRTGSGTSLSGSFETREVDERTPTTITATCVYDDADLQTLATTDTSSDVTPAFYAVGGSDVIEAATQTASASATVVLLPLSASDADAADPDDSSLLPDTGGAALSLLVLGGALVVGGAGVTYAARRRHSVR